jgi:hypothetical protein
MSLNNDHYGSIELFWNEYDPMELESAPKITLYRVSFNDTKKRSINISLI